ncbi:MAG: SHD1 domain-containing protein [Rubripirellula sp.]
MFALLISTVSDAAEPLRIWVDANGQFSVEARLIEVTDDEVILLRDDGGKVAVKQSQLSGRDKTYLDDVKERSSGKENPLRLAAPDQPDVQPLPTLSMPSATSRLEEGANLELLAARTPELRSSLPAEIKPDRDPISFGLHQARIPIFKVDVYDDCSRPIPITTMTSSGTRATSLVMSISGGIRVRGEPARNMLVRFETGSEEAFVIHKHDERIRLLDHHSDSGRTLLLIGHNSLGKGGQLAVASGWNESELVLSHKRTIKGDTSSIAATSNNAPLVRWARWIDNEHILAVIDRSLGLWNIESGKQVYRINGIDHRAEPAVSGGKRYVAVPYQGSVQLFSTVDGKSLGRIGVENQVPGVCFSPLGNTLAIVTSRRMRNWDLPSASLSADAQSRTSLGVGRPTWIDSDLVLSSSGVLLSSFRSLPIWRYDVAAAESVATGRHLVMFRKHPVSELSVISLPHAGANEALGWIDNRPANIDRKKWRLMGRSEWNASGWSDRDVQISSVSADRLR